MIDFIRCSMRILSRKKLRTTLTMLSIAIGVASVVLISSIGGIGQDTINRELKSLGLDGVTIGRARGKALSPLREGDLTAIRANCPVSDATGINVSITEIGMRGMVAQGIVWGIDRSAGQFVELDPMHGRMLTEADERSGQRVCVVDKSVAEAFYKRSNVVGKEIEISLPGKKETFTVVGVVRSGGNILQGLMQTQLPSFVYIPGGTMRSLSLKSDFDQIVVKVENGASSAAVSSSAIRTLEEKNGIFGGYQADNIAKQKETLDRLLKTVTLVLSLIAGVSLIVAALGIMTVMLVSVSERTHEIGIKKSIGAGGHIIMLEFLVEAFTMTFIGSAAGAAIGLALIYLGCWLLGLPAVVSMGTVLLCVGISVAVGVVFGVYPASIAARLRPVDALRGR